MVNEGGLPGLSEPDRIDLRQNHQRGAQSLCAGSGEQTDGTAAGNQHLAAFPDAGQAGAVHTHRAGLDHSRLDIVDAVGEFIDHVLPGDEILGKCTVIHQADAGAEPLRAEVFFPAVAVFTFAAGGVLDRRDPISRLEMSVTGIHDHTAELMAGHSVLPGSNTIAPDHMPIASADARIGHLDQRVPRFSLRHGFFRDRNFFLIHHCQNTHRNPSFRIFSCFSRRSCSAWRIFSCLASSNL